LKIAIAQINCHIGNFSENLRKMKQSLEKGKAKGADLVIFPELAISGYPPRDFLEFDDFINRCIEGIKELAGVCHGIAAIVGGPSRNPGTKGKGLFNSAFFLADGEIKSVHHKSLLPNYDIFDEYRYFEPNKDFQVFEFKGQRIAITICEDLWNIVNDPLYLINPMDELQKQNPDLIINIAASPFDFTQKEKRTDILLKNAEKYKLPLFYVNHVGAQTELLFDGGSMVVSPDAKVFDELAYFEEDFKIFDLQEVKKTKQPAFKTENTSKIERIHDALVMGIKNYFGKLGFKKAILGLSGGIDSAVTMALAARALGTENVYAVLLPSGFSSDHSIDDAKQLAENLGSPYDLIPIENTYQELLKSLQPFFGDLPFNVAEENLQARSRGVILMALSNKFGYILLNTSNKSEAAVGYGTLYGDMNGGLSVIGDVYKTDVFELARYINKDGEVIPENTITKPPSAELRPDQKDSDSLPDYEILDEILYQYIELRKGPKEIIVQGFEQNIVERILKMANTNEYKRYQTPPILRVSAKAFGMGRRMPIVARYLS
jgi:NAD+ synthase (glutamine-hydrolysing)